MTTPDEPETSPTQSPARALLISFSAGCLTFVAAGLAILAGFLIDLRNDTLPRWTLIFLVGSAPITLGGVYLLTRRALRRSKPDVNGASGDGDKSDAD
jgi:peptidoglycan/LPS O-acetylase OafA/YrhL